MQNFAVRANDQAGGYAGEARAGQIGIHAVQDVCPGGVILDANGPMSIGARRKRNFVQRFDQCAELFGAVGREGKYKEVAANFGDEYCMTESRSFVIEPSEGVTVDF